MDALSMLLENVHLYDTQFYYLKGHNDWSFSITRHDTIVFYLMLHGSMCLDVAGQTRTLNAGDVVMIPNSIQHAAFAAEYFGNKPPKDAPSIETKLDLHPSEALHINRVQDSFANADLMLIECCYDKEVTRPILSVLPSFLPEQDQVTGSRQTVMDLVVSILSLESKTDSMGKATVIDRLAGIIMVDFLRMHIEDLPEATDSWLVALKDSYLAKAIGAMHNAPEQNWTISKLAEVAGMSRSSFAERFKQVVGVPPLTYLIDYRLRLAARYLRLQQHSISRISELVGYASDSTFSQAFKRVYGVSPRHYRQQFQESQT